MVIKIEFANVVVSLVVLPILMAGGYWFFVKQWSIVAGFVVITIAAYLFIVAMYHFAADRKILWTQGDKIFVRSRMAPWFVNSISGAAISDVSTNYIGPHVSTNDVQFRIEKSLQNGPLDWLVVYEDFSGLYRINLLACDTDGITAVNQIVVWTRKRFHRREAREN